MSAEILRRAAALMRERADAAKPGPWGTTWDNQVVGSYGSPVDGEQLADCFDSRFEAEHIASWHPAVALAVADLLDGLATDTPWDFRHDDALTVARAYLGSES